VNTKKKHSKLSNLFWAAKRHWKTDKFVLLSILPSILLTVGLNILDSYFPKLILDRLEQGRPFVQLLTAITVLLVLRFLLNTASSWLQCRRHSYNYTPTMLTQFDIYRKNADVLYQLTETQDYRKTLGHASKDACNGNCSAEFYWGDLLSFGTGLLGIGSMAAIFAVLNPVILLVVVATSAVSYFTTKWEHNYREKHKDKWENEDRRKDYLNGFSREFDKAKDIRLYGMQSWIEKLIEEYDTYLHMWEERCDLRGTLASVLSAFMTLLQNGTAYIVLITMLLKGYLNVGDFVFYFGLTASLAGYLGNIVRNTTELVKRADKIGYYRDFFDYEEKTNRGKGSPVPTDAPEIELRNVWFKYEGAGDFTLKDLNLKISSGEKLALVGLNGAGKTTLVKLICGLYLPTQGEILINGRPIADYNTEEYYSIISAVFQDTNLFAVTIAEFVSCEPEKTPERDKRVRDALAKSGLSAKVDSLENGADTYLIKGIYPGAIDLSGGETQKLLLARAIYKTSSILVLDEPTAALDPIAENELYVKYSALTQGKTSVYISHRFASTRFCDRIVLLENGEICEHGTHAELMEKQGRYAELFNVQSKYYREGEIDE